MIPRKPPADFRLSDLAHWHLVYARCAECGHETSLDHAEIKRGRSRLSLLKELEGKLKCSRCGARSGHTISIELMPRG